MRVGIYIDGFNLYYGGTALAGVGARGWKWLDLRGCFEAVARARWPDVSEVRPVVYCTARISSRVDQDGYKRQETYLRALRRSGSVDHIEYGKFYDEVKTRPLATRDRKGRPILVRPQIPLLIQDGAGAHIDDATFMVSVADREEKGSDVNVACHLLLGTLEQRIDAAVVVSNDSDLALAVAHARMRIPVGVVNPGRSGQPDTPLHRGVTSSSSGGMRRRPVGGEPLGRRDEHEPTPRPVRGDPQAANLVNAPTPSDGPV